MRNPRAPEEEETDRDQPHHDHRAKIRFEQNQSTEQADHDQRRQDPAAKQRELVRFLGQIGRKVDHRDQLDHFGRLDRNGTRPQPAPRALRGDPDPGNQDQHQQHQHTHEDGNRELLP